MILAVAVLSGVEASNEEVTLRDGHAHGDLTSTTPYTYNYLYDDTNLRKWRPEPQVKAQVKAAVTLGNLAVRRSRRSISRAYLPNTLTSCTRVQELNIA